MEQFIQIFNLLERCHTILADVFPHEGLKPCPSTANLSKGTTGPRNLRERLAIEKVMANPKGGTQLPFPMTDPRWPANAGWVKMQQIVDSGGDPINVHYVYNTVSGQAADPKVVLPGAR